MGRLHALLHESSIPGFSRFGTFSTKTARSIWCGVLILSFVGFIIHTGFLIARFAKFETVTLTVLNSEPFVYPDVTICNGFPFSHSRSKQNFSFPASGGRNWTGTEFLYQIKNFWKAALGMNDQKLNKYTRSDNPVSRKSLDRYAINLDMAHHFDELIIDCEFQGKPCRKESFEEHIYPFYLKCWTFSPKERAIFEPGPLNGLRLMLHVGDRRAFLSDEEILGWLRGVVTVIHDPRTLAVPKDGAVIAAAGKHTLIELEMTRSVRRNAKTNPCIENSDNRTFSTVWRDTTNGFLGPSYALPDVVQSYEYDSESCDQLQKQREYVAECGCLSETLPMDTSMTNPSETDSASQPPLSYCHELEPTMLFGPKYERSSDGIVLIKDTPSVGQAIDFLSWRKDNVSEHIRRHECHQKVYKSQRAGFTGDQKKCPHRCDSRTYHASVMSYDWPESVTNAKPALRSMLTESMKTAEDPKPLNKTRELYLDDLDRIKTSFLKMDIYPKTMKGTLIEESEAYPFSACFSDFGGVLGLWMGMSIITFIEIFSTCFVRANKNADEDEHEHDEQRYVGNGNDRSYITFQNKNNQSKNANSAMKI